MKNLVCIGLNYADHAAETGAPIPKEPIVFLKSLARSAGPNDDVIIPKDSREDRLGSRARHHHRHARRNTSSEDNALDHVAGYAVGNDVSEREWQIERGGAWDKGKGCDTFGPLGPWLVTKDEVPDPQNLAMFCDVDGVRHAGRLHAHHDLRREAPSSAMSRHFITLHPGDVIFTGTPPGVGLGKKPTPVFLKAGQTMQPRHRRAWASSSRSSSLPTDAGPYVEMLTCRDGDRAGAVICTFG